MKNSNTYYVRFGEHEAVIVEVCVIDEQCRGVTTWFEDRHLQEVLQLLHDVLAVRVGQLQCKKSSTIKASPVTGNIITGNTVRVGYMFKKRPGNQKCLVPNSYLTSTACDEAGELSSFSVVKEKLLVYVCQKIAGSPQAMSKLMKVLGDVKQQTMSISNYFQKVPSPQKPGASHSVPSTSGSVPTHPPSEGRKRTIKNILERRQNRRKDKIATKSTKGRLSDLSRFLYTKHGDATGTANNISDTQNKDSSASVKEISIPNPQHVEKSCSNNGISVNSVTAKQVDGSTSLLSGTNSAASYSVTLIIGEQVTDTHNEQVPQSTNCSSTTTATVPVCTSSSTSPSISSASLSSVCKSVPVSPQLATYSASVSPGSSSTISVDVLKSGTVSSRPSHSSSDSSGEVSILPSASFLTKPREKKPGSTHINKSDDSDQFADKVSLLGINWQHSPVFVKRKNDDKSKCDTVDDCAEISTKLNSGSDHKEVVVHNRKEVKRNKLRWKRKLPDFSDSDSEDIDRLKVITKSRKLEPSSMKENKQKHVPVGKKFNISKSFFSDEKDKVQPTLACFMGNKSTKTVSDEQDTSHRKDTGKDTEDFDCHLLEELSSFPIVKREIDADIRREIQSLKNVSELNEQHLEHLVRNSERYLRDIFQGKVKCERHNMYKQGGKHKRNLSYDSGVGHYTEEQVDAVMEALMAIFCKRHHKYLDYIMKVLLPEMLAKFYVDINGRADTHT